MEKQVLWKIFKIILWGKLAVAADPLEKLRLKTI
jgi:hypothetical protein